MPLSEHEQRQFELIERALYADDPKFAAAVRRREPAAVGRRRLAVAALTVLLGVGTLLAGVILPLWYVGVAGFVVMLGGALLGVAAVRMMTGRVTERVPAPDAASGITVLHRRRRRHPAGPRVSFASRLEERWQRRIERGNL
ncbi:MAG TPA: DUF3040 domain-containing protein [Mycobacteriales bacterium]